MTVTESQSTFHAFPSRNIESLSSVTTSLLSRLRSSKGDLIEKLKELWNEYQNSLTAKSVEDYLSLEHLGHSLRYLARKEPRQVDRPFATYLNAGRPNLMVRPSGEILGAVLSIYMYGPKLQLPSYDEVLLCTPKTSIEEIVLLWRRAMYDTSGRIFCLVNADQLDYEVSTKAEEKRIHLAKDRSINNEYKLVVLCSREKEDHSHMVTALDSYRIDSPALPSAADIGTYLKERFISQALEVSSIRTAASLTHDKCCVQVVTSTRAGVGKSLVVERLAQELEDITGNNKDVCVTVPLAEKHIDQNVIVSTLTKYITTPTNPVSRIFHFDITPAVLRGVDNFLFNMLVLGGISNIHGHIWRRNPWDLYVIEITSAAQLQKTDIQSTAEKKEAKVQRVSFGSQPFFTILPTVSCRSPRETRDLESIKANNELDGTMQNDPLMDDQEFRSPAFQRAYQYLVRKAKGANLDFFDFEEGKIEGDHVQCLDVFLRHCGVADPSWAELRHFVWFLNEQLKDCEHSVFCQARHLEDASLNGFLNFVVRFMMQMSKDFATPSLLMSDESTVRLANVVDEQVEGEEGEEEEEEKTQGMTLLLINYVEGGKTVLIHTYSSIMTTFP
ncbi:E3 ubiquitin-protein ligase RNF213-like [Ptychodera flava]|uniref:E3 ubiquitin-protein ligase RNF213-like n=1 Tax=Ptychodera flava TaxID=63121 RepID=UPI00396A7152